MTPAEELRAAATLVEERAAGATAGPWFARYTDNLGWPVDTAELDGEFSLVAGSAAPKADGRDPGAYEPQHIIAEYDDHDTPQQDRERWANLQWAALLNPLVAAPLVKLFRTHAEAVDSYVADPVRWFERSSAWKTIETHYRAELALARAILGGQR